MKGIKKGMKKESLLKLLQSQKELTKKNTRQDIIAMVSNLANKHIKDGASIDGVNPTRDNTGVNLGEVVEVIMKAIYRNKLAKSDSNKHFDMTIKGEKVEVKFTTSDAYAHPINQQQVVDYYLIVAYSKANGGQVFKVPYSKRNEIIINNQNRVVVNQKVKFLDNDLTEKVFGA